MSRVLKKFLLKAGKGVAILLLGITGIAVWFTAIAFGFLYIGVTDPDVFMPLTMIIGALAPMAGYVLFRLYQDCKEEVDKENREVLRAIKGSYDGYDV